MRSVVLGSLLLTLAACGGSPDAPADASMPRDATVDASVSADSGAPEDDAGELRDAAPDAPVSTAPSIVATTHGVLETTRDAITAVPFGIRGSELLDGLTLSTGATVLLRAEDGSALDPDALLGADARVVLSKGDDERAYAIEMETLLDTIVLVAADGEPRRLDTRFFLNGGAEWIVLDKGSFTHFCMPSDIATGVYGPADGGEAAVCLEVVGLDGLADMGALTSADDFTVDLKVTGTLILGHFHGTLVPYDGEGAGVEVEGWFASGREDSGGW